MRGTKSVGVCVLLVSSIFLAADAAAQDTPPAHAHIGHVADGFRGTPDGMGLLPTAIAEAEVAANHAGFAARDLTNLAAMKGHAGHVLHALDPSQTEGGPGLGYGVIAAASGAARHIELAAAAEGASDGVKTHATHIATSATNTVTRAERMVELAKGIQGAETAEAAAPMVQELAELAGQLAAGADANTDGRVGWQEGEGGLEVANTHLGLMKRGEGLGG